MSCTAKWWGLGARAQVIPHPIPKPTGSSVLCSLMGSASSRGQEKGVHMRNWQDEKPPSGYRKVRGEGGGFRAWGPSTAKDAVASLQPDFPTSLAVSSVLLQVPLHKLVALQDTRVKSTRDRWSTDNQKYLSLPLLPAPWQHLSPESEVLPCKSFLPGEWWNFRPNYAQFIFANPQNMDGNAFWMMPPLLHQCCFWTVITCVVSGMEPGAQVANLAPFRPSGEDLVTSKKVLCHHLGKEEQWRTHRDTVSHVNQYILVLRTHWTFF